jgi:hypothetical protein
LLIVDHQPLDVSDEPPNLSGAPVAVDEEPVEPLHRRGIDQLGLRRRILGAKVTAERREEAGTGVP